MEGGDHQACQYVMALASISLILVFFLWLATFVDALYPILTKFWFVELGINVFQTMWWYVYGYLCDNLVKDVISVG